ncbi:MAG: histidine phosphatase family protein [Acidobacteria bacterium]|nr:histidine phosphatase family protein [Acidobacteriota bacterium]
MIDLILLRHADASTAGKDGNGRDEERPLSSRGMAQSRRAAAAIREWGIQINAILASPYLRTRQTAECVAASLHTGIRPVLCPDLLPEADPAGILNTLSSDPPGDRILLVGHQPQLGNILSCLFPSPEAAEIALPLAAMARISVTHSGADPAYRLESIVPPDRYPAEPRSCR